MRWPLAWAKDLDEAARNIRQLEQNVVGWRSAHDTLAKRTAFVESLLQQMLDRYAPRIQVTPANLEPLKPPMRDEISEAIDLAAGTDKSLARHLARWAKQQQLDGMKEYDIIHAIMHWSGADEWDGSAEDAPSVL